MQQPDSSEFEIEVAPEDLPEGPEHGDGRDGTRKPPGEPSKLLTYMRLCRIPNVFTAFADVAMGYLFVNRGVEHWEALVALLAASGCLYTAGMVLNDVFDVEKDRVERPQRPIPSGAVSLPQARSLGLGLLIAGVVCALAAGWSGGGAIPYRSGVIGVALAVAILLYDGLLKSTIVAPWIMGGCRFLNVLLGMSLASTADGPSAALGYASHELAAAGGMGLYIAGVTWFARNEAQPERARGLLSFGVAVMIGGLTLLAFIPDLAPVGMRFRLPTSVWPFVIIFLMIAPLRRCLVAILGPTPGKVQTAVKQCILSLIVLNAALVMLTNPFGWALAVCALLIPTLLLGRWVYST